MPFQPFDPVTPEVLSFRRKVLSPWKLRFFYLWRLPSLAWWGVRVEALEAEVCTVSIRESYRTKNPFGSIYFGALLGAAELPTGMLCLQSVAGRGDVSMLVTGMSTNFVKKAKGTVLFTCTEGKQIIRTIDETLKTGTPVGIEVTSTGMDSLGEVVAECKIQWSFKRR